MPGLKLSMFWSKLSNRRYVAIAGGILAILLVFILLLPTLLSTSWGRDKLIGYLNKSVPGSVKVEELSLRWFSDQTASGITVRDPQGQVVATIGKLTTDMSPLGLLFSSSDISHSLLQGFPSPQQPHISIPFKGHMAIQDGSLHLRGRDLEQISLDDIHASFIYDASKGVSTLRLRGNSHQSGLSGVIAFQADLAGLNKKGQLFLVPSPSGLPLPEGDAKVRLKLDIENASVDVMDQLLTFNHPAWTGILTDALGPMLNMKLDMLLSSAGPAIEIESDSANLQADLVTRLKEGKLVLERSGKISFRVTPTLFQRFWELQRPNGGPKLALKQDTTINLELERLTIPTLLAKEQSTQPTVRLAIRLSDAEWATSDVIGDFALRDVSGVLERLEASGALVYQLTGTVAHRDQQGSIRLAGKVLDEDGPDGISLGDVVLSATKIPAAVFDSLWNANGLLVDTVGDNVDLLAKYTVGNQTRTLEVQAGSDTLAIPTLEFAVTDGLRLVKPTQVHFQVTPGLVRHLAGRDHVVNLQDRTSVLLTLRDLNIPIETAAFEQQFAIDAEAATAPFVLSGLAADSGRARFSNVKLQAKGEKLPNVRFSLRSEISPDGVTPLLTATLGSVSTLELGGNLASTSHGGLTIGEVRVSLQNELVDARAVAHTRPDGILGLVVPATLRYNLKPDTLMALGMMNPEAPHLVQRTPLEVKVDDFNCQLSKGAIEVLFTRGKILTGEFLVIEEVDKEIAAVRDMAISWRYDRATQAAAAILRAKTNTTNTPGTLELSVDVNNWGTGDSAGWRQAQVNLDLNGNQLPTALVSALTGQKEWTNLVGDTLGITFKGQYGQSGTASLALTADQFDARGSFLLRTKNDFFEAASPFSLVWTVTPDRWNNFQKLISVSTGLTKLPWAVSEPTPLHVTVSKIALPWGESPNDSLLGYPNFAGQLNWDGLQVQDTITGEDVAFDTMKLSFQSANIADALDFQLEAKERSLLGTDASAQMTLVGDLTQIRSANGWLDKKVIGVDLFLKGQELGLTSLLRYPLQRASVSAHLPGLIGRRVSGTTSLQLHGSDGLVKANLIGESGQFDLDGQITNHVLTLNRPLTLELQVTPQLRQGLLRDIAPYMAAARSADHPIRFTVDPVGFALPLDSANLRAARIAQASLELGKVQIDHNSQLGAVISVLNAERSESAGAFNVWFTPLQMSLNEGVLKFNRMDALIADRYPIALWGKIDLLKDRVRMIIGITADALREAYALVHVDDKYMLQLPLNGTIDNATIDKGKATARVTALVAQSQGTTQGVVIGGVLDMIGGGLQDEKVPPPSTPLPWAVDTPKEPIPEKPIAEIRLKPTLPKELKKGAKKLWESIKGP